MVMGLPRIKTPVVMKTKLNKYRMKLNPNDLREKKNHRG